MSKRASVPGMAVRETLRLLMHTPMMKNGGIFREHKLLSNFHWRPPRGYRVEKIQNGEFPMEMLSRGNKQHDKVILQLHGGAYLIALSDLYRIFAYRFCKAGGGAGVLTIDYRIAPRYQHPAALNDALSAWKWLRSNGYLPQNIIVTGDSAGGNLALALTLQLRDWKEELPNSLILMSPWADMTGSGDSRKFNYEKDPLFGKCAGDKTAESIRAPGNPYAGNHDLTDKYLSPVFGEYDGFPPMLIQVGGWEMLLSEARTVAEHARAAGVNVTLTEYPGMFHVFQALCDLLPESRRAWREIDDFIQEQFGITTSS